MRRAVAGILALVLLSLSFSIWNGRRTLVCLGDSNTAAEPSWCDMLQVLLPSAKWRIVNRGQRLALTSYPGDLPRNGRSQLLASLAADTPDVVVMAFGTNDLMLGSLVADGLGLPGGPEIEPVVQNYLGLRRIARAAGVRSFVASTPPLATQNKPRYAPVNALVVRLNGRLREAIPPEELIDFDSPMNPLSDYKDAVHFNVEGQAKRAVAACGVLAAAYGDATDCTARLPALLDTLRRGELTLAVRASRKRQPWWKLRWRRKTKAPQPAE